MSEGFSGENVLWTMNLVVYLLAVAGWLHRTRRAAVARAKLRPDLPPTCPDCKTTASPGQGPWGGWTCVPCDTHVAPPAPPPAKTGWRGWIDRHPWALIGALWATIGWSLLAFGGWWLHQAGPSPLTLPLATLGGFATGWLLSVTVGRD